MQKGLNSYKRNSKSKVVKISRSLPRIWPIDYALEKTFGNYKKRLTHEQIKKNFRMPHITEVEVIYNPITRTVLLTGLTVDAADSTIGAVKKAKKLLKKVETDAVASGARRIITSPTIVNPRVAKRAGYELVKTIKARNGKQFLYTYTKNLHPPLPPRPKSQQKVSKNGAKPKTTG